MVIYKKVNSDDIKVGNISLLDAEVYNNSVCLSCEILAIKGEKIEIRLIGDISKTTFWVDISKIIIRIITRG